MMKQWTLLSTVSPAVPVTASLKVTLEMDMLLYESPCPFTEDLHYSELRYSVDLSEENSLFLKEFLRCFAAQSVTDCPIFLHATSCLVLFGLVSMYLAGELALTPTSGNKYKNAHKK